ncbi:hypothetical protein CR513_41094, partial [Mucuna pruriens]
MTKVPLMTLTAGISFSGQPYKNRSSDADNRIKKPHQKVVEITWTNNGQLTHLLTKGAKFTWSNGRVAICHIEMRLNRAACNDECLSYWNCIPYCTLTKSQSNHHP